MLCSLTDCSLADMALHLRVLLIITGLTGTHSITTVRDVSVKAGDSVSIPCLYASQYVNHVKYLCKGYQWITCSYAVKTNQRNSGKFSIADNKKQRIFTVTVNDLTDGDTDYWCAVEINGGSDVREYFHLSVTRGTPRLSVDRQQITGFKGDNITINCHYQNSGEISWCKLGGSCVTRSSGSIDGTRVTISRSVPNVFAVTMSGLTTESSGWYWCVQGELQMPVNIAVIEQLSTTGPPTAGQSERHSSVSADVQTFIIALSVLIFIVVVVLFIWFILKRHKQTKAAAAAAVTAAEEEITYSDVEHIRKTTNKRPHADSEVDVTYSSVITTTPQHIQGRPHADSDVDVTYSSVVTTTPQHIQGVEANEENVTYSTLA